MADEKIIFVAFAIEDERQRDLLKGQSLSPRGPYKFIDLSVKEAYETDWKTKVRTRIRRCHGVIALVSKNSLTSEGQKWEIQCAKEEGTPVRGIWAYSADRTNLVGVNTLPWTDKNIADFIDLV
ncbi:TIR domain-containing protein [Nocardia testacea]|uniref:TIR domain-containing protein n=1 Tax=Nocardia testacea TaxID=248551 RepID=UPI00030F878A|nr:TIR domain-containing protein [Nocardia testacea]